MGEHRSNTWIELPAAQRIRSASNLTKSVRGLAVIGMRRRHPDVSEHALGRLVVEAMYGPNVAALIRRKGTGIGN